ncbi:MAG: PDDEXK nuclease domain-containing protein [Oscillospiraceae bacterium]|nr:PDDEXK nuclease domain-containing protein [Oscillospiraceae bacterium]
MSDIEKRSALTKSKNENKPNAIAFFESVALVIEHARRFVGRTADLMMCVCYYEVGRIIVEEEQEGKARAEYGRGLLHGLSEFLFERIGKGYSETTLKNARKFYQTYSPSIRQALPDGLEGQIRQALSAELKNANFNNFKNLLSTQNYPFNLSWSHYLILMRIKDEQVRHFYEIESVNQQWTYRQLQRQYGSSLYERLALSRDKDEVMRLANEGQVIEKPRDILKNPLVLEFLGLAEQASFTETDLESAIISKLSNFLLELGKGFLFEARQKRFTFDEDYFIVDLVFYNRLLQCYVLIDLKTAKLKHQDLGQMQMYVNYFDRYVRTEKENPTVGILLCKEKNDSVVELTLPEGANIYASEYSLYLPDKELLQRKLAEWVEEFEEEKDLKQANKSRDV